MFDSGYFPSVRAHPRMEKSPPMKRLDEDKPEVTVLLLATGFSFIVGRSML